MAQTILVVDFGGNTTSSSRAGCGNASIQRDRTPHAGTGSDPEKSLRGSFLPGAEQRLSAGFTHHQPRGV